jgi:hypothetical protein
MSRFDRLCWAWTHLNGFALRTLRANPNARLFRFEDLFLSDRRRETVEELISFCTEVSPHVVLAPDGIDPLLQKKVHASNGSVPAWDGWTPQERERFETMCGPLMAELNYDLN